jgi:chromosomal replication initiation ATPase DnaA
MTGYLHALVEDAAREAGCTVAQILGHQRTRRIAWARQIAMRKAIEEGFSSPEVGRAFNRDYTTVLYAAGMLSKKRPRYPTYSQADCKDRAGERHV